MNLLFRLIDSLLSPFANIRKALRGDLDKRGGFSSNLTSEPRIMRIPRTIQGQWQIFGDDQAPAFGTLKFDPETGLILDVRRHRPPNLAQAFRGVGFAPPTVIRGLDAHGSPVTLFGSVLVNFNTAAALDEYKIASACAIVGAQFNQLSDATFRSVKASFSLLDSWLTRSSLAQVQLQTGLPAFSHQPQPDIALNLPDGTTVTFTMTLSSQRTVTSVLLSQLQFVLFARPDLTPIRTLLDQYLLKFSRFLSFLASTEVFVDEIRIPRDGIAGEDLEWLSAVPGSTKAKRTLHPTEGLLAYHEIAGQFPTLVASWFRYYDEMEAILNLYFTAISKSDIPVNTCFLLLAQALEAYHSRSSRFVHEIQPRADFLIRRDAILNAVADSQERQWLKGKLAHANNKTLSERLNELIGDQPDARGFVPDTTLFANTVRWTRNYYTHYAEDEEERIARGQGRIPQGPELAVYCSQMRALLELHFIADLQLPRVATDRAINRAQQMRIITAQD
jgi:hypothetical protein